MKMPSTHQNGTSTTKKEKKSVAVACIGFPNVGKSTLLNTLTKQKLSIVSHHSHTTRKRVVGTIYENNTQIIVYDTPGFHYSINNAMNRAMQKQIFNTLDEIDVLIWILRCDNKIQQNLALWLRIRENSPHIPLILVCNQIDRLSHHTKILPILESIHNAWGKQNYHELVPISAKKNTNISTLKKIITTYAPHNHWLYPKDFAQKQPQKFFVAEIIREKILWQTHGEIPHQFGVLIESMKKSEKNIWYIHALIKVDRKGQKAIILGKKGTAIKNAATKARIELEKYLKNKVMLEIFVHIRSGWRNDKPILIESGYDAN